jgi:hypothetical protein
VEEAAQRYRMLVGSELDNRILQLRHLNQPTLAEG